MKRKVHGTKITKVTRKFYVSKFTVSFPQFIKPLGAMANLPFLLYDNFTVFVSIMGPVGDTSRLG